MFPTTNGLLWRRIWRCFQKPSGSVEHALREVFNGLRYVVRNGIPWRAMPHDLPPWAAVYQQAARWLKANCFATLAHDLRALLRLAGILVRKDETASDTDATQKVAKVLKICTFKVRPEKRGLKIGELLLKEAFWSAQRRIKSGPYDFILTLFLHANRCPLRSKTLYCFGSFALSA